LRRTGPWIWAHDCQLRGNKPSPTLAIIEAGARNLNGQASQFAIRTGPFSNVGRPAQGPATFNDLATRLPTAARARLNRSERTNRSLLPTHSGAQNTQFRAASIAIGIVLMAAHNGG
jgi:hypothetical protein